MNKKLNDFSSFIAYNIKVFSSLCQRGFMMVCSKGQVDRFFDRSVDIFSNQQPLIKHASTLRKSSINKEKGWIITALAIVTPAAAAFAYLALVLVGIVAFSSTFYITCSVIGIVGLALSASLLIPIHKHSQNTIKLTQLISTLKKMDKMKFYEFLQTNGFKSTLTLSRICTLYSIHADQQERANHVHELQALKHSLKTRSTIRTAQDIPKQLETRIRKLNHCRIIFPQLQAFVKNHLQLNEFSLTEDQLIKVYDFYIQSIPRRIFDDLNHQ